MPIRRIKKDSYEGQAILLERLKNLGYDPMEAEINRAIRLNSAAETHYKKTGAVDHDTERLAHKVGATLMHKLVGDAHQKQEHEVTNTFEGGVSVSFQGQHADVSGLLTFDAGGNLLDQAQANELVQLSRKSTAPQCGDSPEIIVAEEMPFTLRVR